MSGGMEEMARRQELEEKKKEQHELEAIVRVIDDWKWVLAKEIRKVQQEKG